MGDSNCFDHQLKVFFDNAAKEHGALLKNSNLYPRIHHDLNKYFFNKSPSSYRLLRLSHMGILRKLAASPSHTIDKKNKAYDFAKRCGVKCPGATVGLALEDLSFEKIFIVKPVYSNGGKCIYSWMRTEEGEYLCLFTNQKAKDEDEIKKIMRREFDRKNIKIDLWVKEELVVGKDGTPQSTKDVKFYSFYGNVEAVLQVDRWDTRRYTFFDKSGVEVDVGRYPIRKDISPAFNSELLAIAKDISKKIPWPHVRLDFLVSDNDYSFGEFSTEPGNFSEFNDTWDRKLGVAYQEAFGRLYVDFLNGKEFKEYKACFGPFE